MHYGIRLYKNTNKWSIYYLCPHSGHVYLDVRFDTENEAKEYVKTVLKGSC